MLEKLFAGKQPLSAVPAGERIYAIGDIHGCADLLRALLALIEADAGANARRLIFLGDYIDRGADSRGVLDQLAAMRSAHPETVFLKGNHEQAMADFLLDPDRNEEWLHWGGDKTLASYGLDEIWSRTPRFLADELETRLPAAHRVFLAALEPMRVFGDYAFVHAGVKPGVALDLQDERDLLWIRNEFHDAPADQRPDKIIVHGHHPVRKPLDAGWRIDVDTGAVWSDALTAVVLEGTSRRFLSTGKF